MVFKARISKKTLADHFKYYVWVYVVALVLSVTFFNMSIDVINGQAPREEQLFSYVCGESISMQYFVIFHEEMTEAFPDMKYVVCENLAYNDGTTQASIYKNKFLSLVSEKYGDVMILPYNEFTDLAKYGYFAPLEDDFGEYIDDVDPVSLKTVTMNTEENGTHVYGIPLSHLEFFPYDYDTSDKVLVLTSYSQNVENAKKLFAWYLDYMLETDWYGTIN
ncbi:MAG: hypothetical protein J6L92_08225 [Clostridia bacterium]|nr:hypothetical protein [Clostridia bacterium]